MIDTNFITRYTTGLYSTSLVSAPRYDEFRDMFSAGQLHSKEWLVSELDKLNLVQSTTSLVIVGSWYGTLGFMLNQKYPYVNITMIDIDARCTHFVKNISHDIKNLHAHTVDMFDYQYRENIVINTSCEHIRDISKWISLIPVGTVVVLQSNNYVSGVGHLSCAKSLQEFQDQCNLPEIIYSGQLEMPVYTRYMIIGKT